MHKGVFFLLYIRNRKRRKKCFSFLPSTGSPRKRSNKKSVLILHYIMYCTSVYMYTSTACKRDSVTNHYCVGKMMLAIQLLLKEKNSIFCINEISVFYPKIVWTKGLKWLVLLLRRICCLLKGLKRNESKIVNMEKHDRIFNNFQQYLQGEM